MVMAIFKDYYLILGISSDATSADIEKAVQERKKELYNQKGKDWLYSQNNMELKEASEILLNPSNKAIYDQELELYNASDKLDDYEIKNEILAHVINYIQEKVKKGPPQPSDSFNFLQDFVKSIENAYRKISATSGCTSRKEYWFWILYVFFLSFFVGPAILTVISLMGRDYGESFAGMTQTICLVLFLFAIIVPSWTISVRRLHDSGHSGWHMCWLLIPFCIGCVVFIVFMLLPSNPNSIWRNGTES